MAEYLVFFGRRGQNTIVWNAHENPLGVFSGRDAQEAMQSAAQYHGVMGAFFAIEGEFWGVTPNNVPRPFGSKQSADDQLGLLLQEARRRLELPEGEGE